jgi:uncharacterized membrane protein YtjA (UPF0391 family)
MQPRSLFLLIVALLALILGSTGTSTAADIAKTAFFLALILFIFSMLTGLGRRA